MFFITHIIVQENTEAVDFLYNTYYRTGKHWGTVDFLYNTFIVQENTEAVDCLYNILLKHIVQENTYRTGKHWGSRFSL